MRSVILAASILVSLTAFAQDPTWTRKFPTNNPPARRAHAMAYDATRSQVVLFGGEGVNAFNRFADTWVWDGLTWTQKFSSTNPSQRTHPAMAYDAMRDRVVLFGGDDNAGPASLAETWIWDGSDWMRKLPTTVPPGRRGHGMAYDATRGEVVLFGGTDAGGNLLADTWIWNGSNWIQRFPTTSPPARFFHAMAFDPASGHAVLFGGSRAPLPPVADTWIWDGANWTQKFPTTNPSPRGLHAMAWSRSSNQVVMFGGIDLSTLNTPTLADTWVWDGANWVQRFPSSSPTARGQHAISGDTARGGAVLFGGFDENTSSNLADTWVWDSIPPTSCEAPTFIHVDNTRGFGVFEGTIGDLRFNNLTTASVNVQATELLNIPFLRPRGVQFWMSIETIVFDARKVTVQVNESDNLGASFAEHRLIAPGTHASFLIGFCQPTAVTFELGFDRKAILLTLADQLVSLLPVVGAVTPGAIAGFAQTLDGIPLVKSAVTHYANSIRSALAANLVSSFRELSAAGQDLVRLTRDTEQQRQLLQAYRDLGINVTARAIFRALLGAPARVFETFSNVLVLAIQMGFGREGPVRIVVVGE